MASEGQMEGGKETLETDLMMGSRIGRLQGVDELGRVLVACDGHGPVPARLVAGLSRDELAGSEYRDREVLLTFEEGDARRPIITHLMSIPLESMVEMEIGDRFSAEPQVASLDGKRVRLDAEEEIVLSCGPASITLKKDGKVIIKGDSIVSRARGLNHIEGGATRVY